jgi:hypothetical protein
MRREGKSTLFLGNMKMKKLLIVAASSATLFAAAPAFAQASDDSSFQVTASVPGTCTIGNPGTIALNALNVNTTAGSTALTLINNGNSGYVANVTNNFWVSCNDVNKMTITSANNGRLVRAGAAPTAAETAQGFTDKIAYHIGATNYRPGVDWQYQPTLNEGSNNNYMNHTRGAIHQEVGMMARIGSSGNSANVGKRPLAGSYSDTVTVTVQIAA